MLKSVEEHNKDRREEKQRLLDKLACTEVACPRCGNELRWVEPYQTPSLLHRQPTAVALCPACKHQERLER